MDRLELTNYKYKILNEISSILKITSGEALAIFNFIEQYADSGIAEVSRIDGADNSNKFISGNGLYYINIKMITLVVIANLLDINLTHGVLGITMSILGISTKGIFKLSPDQGETCILQEVIISKKDLVDRHLLSNHMEECINNHIACGYRKEGRCGCTTEDVKKILDNFCNKGLLERLDDDNFRIRDTWLL